MTAKAALCKALLAGKKVSIRTGFTDLGVTNCPREISRGVEQAFGVTVERIKKEGKSRWGVDCIWFEYKLNPLKPENIEGVKKMYAYIIQEGGNMEPVNQATTDKQEAINATIRKTMAAINNTPTPKFIQQSLL